VERSSISSLGVAPWTFSTRGDDVRLSYTAISAGLGVVASTPLTSPPWAVAVEGEPLCVVLAAVAASS